MSNSILCYVSPGTKDLLLQISYGYDATAEVLFASFFNNCDSTGFRAEFSEKFDRITTEEINECKTNRSEEIVARCRFLRSLDSDLAIKHVAVAQACARNLLDKIQPKLFLSEAIDQYAQDILFDECNARGIKCHGFIRTFANGYYRRTQLGEYNKMRNIGSEDAKLVEQCLMSPSYLPSNLVTMKKSPQLSYFNIMIRNILRVIVFGLLRLSPKNRFNYHVHASYIVCKNCFMHFVPARQLGFRNWRDKLDPKKKTLFFPLQHCPESTIDYWSDDLSIVDYEAFVEKVVEKTSESFNLVIKEHPGVWGFRKPNFYDKIRNNKSVILAPTGLSSNECLKSTDAVLTVTGSIGFEAALRGIPVFVLGAVPYYRPDKSRLIIKLSANFNKNDIISALTSIPRELKKEKRLLLDHFTGGVELGTFRNDGSYDKNSELHVLEARKIGENIKNA